MTEQEDIAHTEDLIMMGLSPRASGRLSFYDRCAAFRLLNRGFPQNLVALTFGLSQAGVSRLANCKENGAYKQVVAEFERLGPDEFRRHYTNQHILERLQRFRAEMPELGDRRRGLRKGRVPNPDSNEYAGKYRDHGGYVIEILWVDEWDEIAKDQAQEISPGWWVLTPAGIVHGGGDTRDKVCRTSKEAYQTLLNPDWPDPVKIN